MDKGEEGCPGPHGADVIKESENSQCTVKFHDHSLQHSYTSGGYQRHIYHYNKHTHMTLLNAGIAPNVKLVTDSFP